MIKHQIRMHIFTSFLLALFFFPHFAYAISTPTVKGMNHIVVSPKTTTPEQEGKEQKIITPEEKDLAEEREKKDQVKKAIFKPLQTKADKLDYFVTYEKLQDFPYLRELLSSDQTTQDKAIEKIEEYPEFASPMALLLAAEYYNKKGEKEKAAFYLLGSQLRAKFDIERWPVMNDSGLRARQKQHPANSTFTLSKEVSKNILGWFVAQKPRALRILNDLKKWDRETSYAYKPTYEIPSKTEQDTWQELHDTVTQDFINKQLEIITLIHP